jgi:hypothetical protein
MHDDGLLEQKAWAAGIASGYHDVDGRYYPAKPGVLAALLARLADEEHAEGDFDAVEVAAAGSVAHAGAGGRGCAASGLVGR